MYRRQSMLVRLGYNDKRESQTISYWKKPHHHIKNKRQTGEILIVVSFILVHMITMTTFEGEREGRGVTKAFGHSK